MAKSETQSKAFRAEGRVGERSPGGRHGRPAGQRQPAAAIAPAGLHIEQQPLPHFVIQASGVGDRIIIDRRNDIFAVADAGEQYAQSGARGAGAVARGQLALVPCVANAAREGETVDYFPVPLCKDAPSAVARGAIGDAGLLPWKMRLPLPRTPRSEPIGSSSSERSRPGAVFATFPTFARDVSTGSSRQKPTFNVRPAGISERQKLAESGKAGQQREARQSCQILSPRKLPRRTRQFCEVRLSPFLQHDVDHGLPNMFCRRTRVGTLLVDSCLYHLLRRFSQGGDDGSDQLCSA